MGILDEGIFDRAGIQIDSNNYYHTVDLSTFCSRYRSRFNVSVDKSQTPALSRAMVGLVKYGCKTLSTPELYVVWA